jgi:small subunit ribosomal protein S4
MSARVKIIRRLGTPLPGLTRKPGDRRPYPPGVHGPKARRRKSDYRRQLEEKQKVRFHYGVSETQLRRAIGKTERDQAERGGTRLEMLERRLDNAVFRLGWAQTIPAARQLVTHGHVRVNGRRVDRPGYTIKSGDELELANRARQMARVIEAIEQGPQVTLPGYLTRDPDRYTGRVVAQPSRKDVPFEVDEMAVIEFYAR